MSGPRRRRGVVVAGVAAAAWSLAYVISKIGYALQGRLGVTGGPEVPPSAYDAYGPGDVAAAQWSNAGVGMIILLAALAALLPATRRVVRWTLTGVLALVTLLLGLGAALFLGRALVADVGGVPFGLYCVIWCGLYGIVLITHLRAAGHPGRDSPR